MRCHRVLTTVYLVLVTSSCLADAGSPDEKIDLWHGYTRRTFTVDGCQAWVVEPKQALPGKPWSWCLEFPDAFTDRCAAPALLAKGFHHVHIVVGNTFGCPAALKHFNAFYEVLRRRGLAQKAVLIGLSRGGLYAYRWASENPDKVAVIYGDAPVCDFKSWPGGKGQGKGSPGDWLQLLKCYGFHDEAQALAYRGNPVDTLERLAQAGIALIHVVGDVDDMVPVAENTAIVESRYRQLGGEIQVLHRPNVGHHPHGLDDPTVVVDFIMAHVTRAAKQQVADQHDVIGVAAPRPSAAGSAGSSDHWFPQAGLGLFLHWGLASIPGNLDLSWGMMKNTPWDAGAQNRNKLTPAAYFALAQQFQPMNYHPDHWLQAAKEAGFGYAVLTTRHHDGFALWPSQHGDFSTRTYLAGRDLVREYVDACRRQGLKVGFYYSPPDWHFERQYRSFGYGTKGTAESPHLGLNHEPVELPERPADFEEKYVSYVNGQLEELLTWYGHIDYLWFDGSAGPKVLSREQIRKLQPGIIVNDRQHGRGDVATAHYEYQLPKAPPAGWWEHCFSMVGAWGYTKPEHCAPANLLISKLARVRTWGGNVLANYGPRPDGEMPDCFYQSMAEIKDWMARGGTSLVGVAAGPFPDQCNLPVTVRGKTWFVHLLPKTSDGPASEGTILLTGTVRPERAVMLATGKTLAVSAAGDRFTLEVPREWRTGSDDVVMIAW